MLFIRTQKHHIKVWEGNSKLKLEEEFRQTKYNYCIQAWAGHSLTTVFIQVLLCY